MAHQNEAFEGKAQYPSHSLKEDDEHEIGFSKQSSSSTKFKVLVALLVILLVLAIIFLALYVEEKNKNKLQEENGKTGQVRDENESSTVAPTNSTITKAPTNSTITKAPTNSTITKAPTAIPTQPDYGEGPWQKVRIPKYFKPVHYDIVLKVDLVQLIFSGNVQINVSLTTKVDCMYLHTNLLNITEPRLEDNQGRRLSLERHFWYKKNQFYVLDPEDELLPGYYIIKMNFVGELKDDLKGLYKSTYKNKNGEEITIAATQLQPTDARKVFPCFDEPSFKATFQVTIHRANNMISITNTPKMKTEKQSNDISADYYHKTVIMPTYLLAFVVCDFEYEQEYAGKKNSSMRYYAPSNQIDQTKLARSVGGKILEKFENYFNITYPLQKADMIAIPDFAAGAMENWGLITYRETALLFKEGQSSESNKERITLVISHELAHMWFGNLVTTEWWDDLWLNEGFASYVEYIGIDHVFPEWKIKDIFVVTDMQQAFSLDGLVTSHPILLAVEHPDEINEIFDSISYSKGAAILRMLDNFLGEKTFQKGLINYLNEFSYSNAKTKDLWRFLAKASAEDGSNLNVSDIMDTWTLQMNYPVINVTLRNKEIVLTQKRFLSDPEADESAAKYNSSYGYKWFVPFTIEVRDSNTSDKISSNETKTIWMEPSDHNVTVENKTVDATKQWVKGNIGQTGFYLINYDENNWQMLAKQLIFDHEVLSISDRAGLIQDVFALANADQLQYKYALDMTKYLDNEMEYVPWRAAIRSLNIILSLLPSTSDMGKRLMNYRFNKIKHLHDKLGYNDTGTHLEKYIRSYIIESACSLKKEVCMSRVKEYFDNWIKNETKYPVPANLRSAVYFYGMSQSGEKEWDIMFDRFLKTNVASERRKLMYGLAGINEPWLIVRYLEYAFDKSKIKSQDTNTVVSYVANYNPIGRHFAWSFMKEKWPVILETYGKGFAFLMNSFVSTVTAGFNTEWELEQVKDFYAKYPQSGTGSRARQQVLETIKSQMTWRKKNEKLVKEWLDQNNIN